MITLIDNITRKTRTIKIEPDLTKITQEHNY